VVKIPRLQSATFQSQASNPVGPGVLIQNLVEFSAVGVKAAIAGDTAAGLRLGAMTSAPSISISREVTDRTEAIVGLDAPFVGAQVLRRTDVVVECELVQLSNENIMRMHPGLAKTDWMSSASAKLTTGTGNAAFNLIALAGGVGGNGMTRVVVAPSGAATTVTVTGATGSEVLTINPKTAETANGVVDAINANAAAKLIVQAGLPASSDGTGAVAAAISASLAGGTAGSKVGVKLAPTGSFKRSDYMRNLTLCLEGDNQDLLQIWRVDNAFQTDDLDYSPDDEGGVSGMSCTFTGHVTEANFDPVLGNYISPYAIYNFDVATVV
jgi:hypothetical protein